MKPPVATASKRAVHAFQAPTRPPASVRSELQRRTLESRIAELDSERRTITDELGATASGGDMADRSFNVNTLVRLEELDEQVAVLTERLSTPSVASRADSVPSAVSLQFPPSDVVERFVIGYLSSDFSRDVITLDSPLGRALVGAQVGDAVTYAAVNGRQITVVVTDLEP